MMKHLGNLFFFSASIVLITLSCNKQQQNLVSNPGNWVQKFQIGGWPRNGASGWVIGDTGYLVAGYNSINDSCLSDLWQFDPNLNRWAQKAYFPGGARQAGVGFAVGTNGYFATGYNSKIKGKSYQDCWQYSPASNSWTRKADLPDINGTGTGARYDALAFSIGNFAYVGTGFNGTWLNDIWKFDPVANSWTSISNTPINKRSGAVAFVYNNIGYICTGSNNGNEQYDFWKYDPSSGNWTQLRDIFNANKDIYNDSYTTIIRDHGVALVQPNNGVWKAYVTTGLNGTPNNKTWEYDFATDLWVPKSPYERAGRQGAVSWSFINLQRGFVGTGNSSTLSLDDYDEWFPSATFNSND